MSLIQNIKRREKLKYNCMYYVNSVGKLTLCIYIFQWVKNNTLIDQWGKQLWHLDSPMTSCKNTLYDKASPSLGLRQAGPVSVWTEEGSL